MRMRLRQLLEDQAARTLNAQVVEWLHRAYARPDAGQLYIHGSRNKFETFKQPNLSYGHLIFFSKLAEHPEYKTSPLQAEYYGQNLYLVKLAATKIFDPSYVNREARDIMAAAIPADVWDRENKLQWGRLDYQDLHYIVPLAVQYGYNMFRVFEVSMGKDSYGVTDPSLITVIDRFPAG